MAFFSHIYIEKTLATKPETQKILGFFPDSEIIPINHYKDVFCRSRQDFYGQKESPALILAEKKGELIYEGAAVCQSFGNEHFYYTSCIMNCIYNCEYCYLAGMYPSGNVVMFLNREDYFSEVRSLLKRNPMYICVSYDTDLLALNHVTGFLNNWIEFADSEEGLSIEIRTKCGNLSSVRDSLKNCRHPERVIFAYTLSPEEVISKYEKGTSTLKARLNAMCELQGMGIPCRIAFDPMIMVPDWKRKYKELSDTVFKGREGYPLLNTEQFFDASVGTFRISDTYLKNMRKNAPLSAVAQYPYECTGGVYHYPEALMNEMELFMTEQCRTVLPEEKIFRWKENM